MAAEASLPVAVTVISEPWAAASIKTPMMLFPFTLLIPLVTHISERNREEILTKRAAARAWRPNSLRTLKVLDISLRGPLAFEDFRSPRDVFLAIRFDEACDLSQ